MKWRQYDRYSKNMYFSHKIYRYKRSLDSQVMQKVTTNFWMLRKLDLLFNIIEEQLVEYTSWWSDPHNTQRIYLHSACIQAIIYLIGLALQNIILHLIQNHWLCYHNNFIISKHSFAAHIWCYLVRIIFYIYSTLEDMTCLQHRNIYCLTIFIAHNFTYILHHGYHYFHIQWQGGSGQQWTSIILVILHHQMASQKISNVSIFLNWHLYHVLYSYFLI